MKLFSMHCVAAGLFACLPLSATTINFDAQSVTSPSSFTGVANSPLTIGIATFTGGQLLNNAASATDTSGIYATATIGKLVDPLTIMFSQSVSAFSLLITDEVADTYIVSDNKGGSASMAVNGNTSQLFSLTDVGITSVTVASTISNPIWDFAIDNVTFTPTAVLTPEPSYFLFVGLLLGAGLWRFAQGRSNAA